ncbi:hypothetical protein A2673_02375 [Candidatus Kaiserbacteria bacterium RIFCSPHIGHO2_01_FULL_50_13]|uniref:Type 4 fimbrial biogenesis protein PilX N-terminal domain-containing protein n=1 Tax=Candidatus Kaiserbacteria bacterium RIFCSPLOWO2_01_FULL_50_24 TaxID=1798507 RepID=A0A1F6EQY0_9BACT|nr:MAG: hypothetical protein A2673_02375 [Candidatus Kaiserbacteria bacterium RIFCSPHIGHO2_01_FULL_50_13]OGG76028.1 MAG: hypothetical protein A3A34_00040 [Candidatus Kaiserbacteria bacterium RIFCSPLOWO2_01_FULL_50_24]OGG82034.1 MAG: hypothetical protein A3H74_03455 [Candidatus Kaiserbacteria bacterium RIFCSPLOWO2_02_FULL_51_13]
MEVAYDMKNQKSKIKNQNDGADFALQNLRSNSLRRFAALRNFDIYTLLVCAENALCLCTGLNRRNRDLSARWARLFQKKRHGSARQSTRVCAQGLDEPTFLHFAFRAERGFTLLLTALVSAIVVSLGISIFSLSQKEIILSSIGRESQFAFYAADSSAECALYLDIRHASFGSTPPASPPTCDGQTLITSGHSLILPYTVTFQYAPNGLCADVRVTKNSIHPRTLINADGYNVPCGEVSTSPRALQRSVEMRY